jgi:hypothetical protein
MVPKTGNAAWNDHQGGPCPLAAERKVIVRYRNGVESPELAARERRWESWPRDVGDSDWDIVAWVVGSS